MSEITLASTDLMDQAAPDAVSDLLHRCARGDQKAQMQLYQQHHKAMYNTSLRIVHDVFEAEDVMQESFLAAFESLDQLDSASKFGAWLKRIVVNRSINRLQQRKTYQEVIDQYGAEAEAEEIPAYEGSHSMQEIKAAIDQLPEGYRIILNLYLFEGYDHEEISEILNISSATSRSQYNRGKKRLVEQLSSHERH